MKRTPLHRKTRLKAGTTRLKVRRRSKRFAHRRDPAFLEWVRGLPCVHGCPPPSDPHHVRGRKLNDVGSVVPCCRKHHREFHDRGRATVERLWGMDLMVEAARIAKVWHGEAA